MVKKVAFIVFFTVLLSTADGMKLPCIKKAGQKIENSIISTLLDQVPKLRLAYTLFGKEVTKVAAFPDILSIEKQGNIEKAFMLLQTFIDYVGKCKAFQADTHQTFAANMELFFDTALKNRKRPRQKSGPSKFLR